MLQNLGHRMLAAALEEVFGPPPPPTISGSGSTLRGEHGENVDVTAAAADFAAEMWLGTRQIRMVRANERTYLYTVMADLWYGL